MSSKEVMKLVRTRLIDNKGMFDILASLDLKDQKLSYSYYCNEDLNIIHVILD